MRFFVCLLSVLLLAALAGCASPADSASAEPPSMNLEIRPEHAAEVATMLARADLVDGAEDNVIQQCPGCALAMEGSQDFSLDVAGYALHFCSDECKANFAETTEASILALDLEDPAAD